MRHQKFKTLFIILSAIITFFVIGVIITKISVKDSVLVDAQQKRCANSAYEHFDNRLEHAALALGKIRIVAVSGPSEVTVEPYTIFRIPLGVLRGQPNMKLGINCNMVDPGDWNASVK